MVMVGADQLDLPSLKVIPLTLGCPLNYTEVYGQVTHQEILDRW